MGCTSGQTNAPKKTEAHDTLRKRYAIDRDKLTRDVMNYCRKDHDPAITDFFMAYKEEFPDADGKWDARAFKNVKLSVDSFDANFKAHPLKHIQADVSMTVSRSENRYTASDELGRLFFVGLRFDLTDQGEIIRHREYLVFFNNKQKKSSDKTKIIFLNDGRQKRAYDYRKQQ